MWDLVRNPKDQFSHNEAHIGIAPAEIIISLTLALKTLFSKSPETNTRNKELDRKLMHQSLGLARHFLNYMQIQDGWLNLDLCFTQVAHLVSQDYIYISSASP